MHYDIQAWVLCSNNGLHTVIKVLADIGMCDWWRYCKALCDIQFSQIEGYGQIFCHIELSSISSAVKFSNSVKLNCYSRCEDTLHILRQLTVGLCDLYRSWRCEYDLHKPLTLFIQYFNGYPFHKETVSRDCWSLLFSQITLLGPLMNRLNWFC